MNKSTKENEWWDYTWNPISGCSPISAGCQNCYAAAISKRFGLPWGKPVFHPERLNQPAKLKKPARIFVCSMSDYAHPLNHLGWIMDINAAMHYTPQHRYMIITKRPLMLSGLPPPRGTWIGVTIENHREIDRLETLFNYAQSLKYAMGYKLFVSVEPMLEPIRMQDFAVQPDWVIAGPETGPNARPCPDEWIDNLAKDCPCFFDKRPKGTRREFPEAQHNEKGRAG